MGGAATVGPGPVKNLVFRSEPSLPEGMILNPADGSISGSPLVEAEEAEYTIIAENKAGSVSSTVVIRVRLQDQTDAHARTWEERDATYADANIFCKIARGEIHVASSTRTTPSLPSWTLPLLPGGTQWCPPRIFTNRLMLFLRTH